MEDYVDTANPEALLDYYAQYLNNPNAISAAPALNQSALLKPTEYGPSIPSVAPSSSILPKRDSSQAAPYPAGYSGATSLAAKATAVTRPSTMRIVEDRKRTNFNTPTSSSISGSNPLRRTSVLRQGGGQTWADDSLLDWDERTCAFKLTRGQMILEFLWEISETIPLMICFTMPLASILRFKRRA